MAAVVLANYPFVSQLAEHDVNNRMDCVAASLASAIQWLDRKPVTGAQLKDATYGTSYVGGTALIRYVDQASDLARRVYGVNAEVITAEPSGLVTQVHTLLQKGYPVIASIPSTWGTARTASQLDSPSFSTHAICFYGELNSGGLQAMNPWGGFNHTGSDAYWRARLCYRQVWRVYRVSGGATVSWQKGSDGWYRDSKGHKAGGTVGAYLRDHGLLGVDALADQVYYSASDAFLALSNGSIVTSHKDAQGNWSAREGEGASLLLNFYGKAQQQPSGAPAPADPLAAKALALWQDVFALQKEL